ncbi:HigA family addiction module antitoxin [Butyrivibrio sp. WCD3002]|uniref:HigA family addiction module antitoxin n=1 Tax=Butyrivibrio sp. WCD3002 TaxID=1280676 RepID=UPI00040BAF77|nr:HigA family addiction module antitoxin [Butyrivibrio sp. WCD3002]
MSNFIEYNDTIAFHPGYYIKEIIDESGLTQEDFAKRLNTTAKNLSIIIKGEQSLSVDIAMKLSKMLGTSITYWLNLQTAYDAAKAEADSEEELREERRIFNYLDYKYFREHYGLSDLPRKKDEQIVEVRKFLNIASLTVLTKQDLAVNFRSAKDDHDEASTVRANAMVQVAINKVLATPAPKFDKRKFEKAVNYALTLTTDHRGFYPKIKKAFYDVGVIFVIMPNLSGSKTNGATKRIGNNIMLMVNDCRLNADSFWFTLFHEIGHIINGDYGISFENETGEKEVLADRYAESKLIPPEEYDAFIAEKKFDVTSIKRFAVRINRDPGIVIGRLTNDKYVRFDDVSLKALQHKYKIQTVF